MKPTIGRIVLVGTLDKYNEPCVIPAIIVRVWSDTCVNVIALNDGTNDLDKGTDPLQNNGHPFFVKWFTSVNFDEVNILIPSNNHWIWPPKV